MKCYVMRPFSDQCHEQQQQQQHHAVMWRASLMDTSRQKSIPYTVNSVLSITYGEYVPEVSEIVFFYFHSYFRRWSSEPFHFLNICFSRLRRYSHCHAAHPQL